MRMYCNKFGKISDQYKFGILTRKDIKMNQISALNIPGGVYFQLR